MQLHSKNLHGKTIGRLSTVHSVSTSKGGLRFTHRLTMDVRRRTVKAWQESNATSKITKLTSMMRNRLYVDPTSNIRLVWDVIGMLMILYDLILLPLDAFDWGSAAGSMKYPMLATTVYWSLDIF